MARGVVSMSLLTKMGGNVSSLLALLFMIGCGAPPHQQRPDPIYLDPAKYNEFIPSPELIAWTQSQGIPKEEKYELMMQSFPIVNGAFQQWKTPTMLVESQKIYVDYDDESDPKSPCIVKGFAAYTWTCSNHITVCKRFIFGGMFNADLYGVKGWVWMLMHELLHAYCEPDHVAQLGRADHFSGPIMCAWSSDCVDYTKLDYQPEDLALLCRFINGGPCLNPSMPLTFPKEEPIQ